MQELHKDKKSFVSSVIMHVIPVARLVKKWNINKRNIEIESIVTIINIGIGFNRFT